MGHWRLVYFVWQKSNEDKEEFPTCYIKLQVTDYVFSSRKPNEGFMQTWFGNNYFPEGQQTKVL